MTTLDDFDEVPLDELYRITRNLMLFREEISADDVQKEVYPRSASKHNPAVFKRLKREGIITEDGTKTCRRRVRHGGITRNWRVL